MDSAIIRAGIKAALGIPALSIFFTMLGFSALAREAGFTLEATLATTILVWGMPGQVAMVSLSMAEASLFVIFTAVSLANMRMLLMTISGMNMMGMKESNYSFFKKMLVMQMLAITSWIQLGVAEEQYSKSQLRPFFIGLATTIYIAGLLGTVLGFYMKDWLSFEVVLAVLVITPLYILLMVIKARRLIMRFAGVIGGTLCPLLFPLIGEWAIFVSGLVGGSLVLGLWHLYQGRERQ